MDHKPMLYPVALKIRSGPKAVLSLQAKSSSASEQQAEPNQCLQLAAQIVRVKDIAAHGQFLVFIF